MKFRVWNEILSEKVYFHIHQMNGKMSDNMQYILYIDQWKTNKLQIHKRISCHFSMNALKLTYKPTKEERQTICFGMKIENLLYKRETNEK